jgi:dTDP-4-dehydrorhamnose reductase
MTWLITGGSGQLGLALQKELTSRKITFVSTNSNDLDISITLEVDHLVSTLKPDVLINAAAWTDVDGAEVNKTAAFLVNSFGAKNLANAAKRAGSIFVQISTDYIFSGENSVPWLEMAFHAPQSVYGASKSEGEKQVLEIYPDGAYVIRTAWLYSSKGKNFAKTMAKIALKTSGQVRVVSDQVGQPTFAQDLAKQIVELILDKSPFGIYHGTNSGEATWFEFAKEIFMLAGADVARVIPVSSEEYSRPAKRPTYSVLGHDAWENSSVPKMRDWRIALSDAMPDIISEVSAEG